MSNKYKNLKIERPLKRQFFLAVENQPNWYRMVTIESYSDVIPSKAKLQANTVISKLQLLNTDDRDHLMTSMSTASRSIRRQIANKIACRFVRLPWLIHDTALALCGDEKDCRQRLLNSEIVEKIFGRHSETKARKLLNNLHFLRTFDTDSYEVPSTIVMMEKTLETLDFMQRVVQQEMTNIEKKESLSQKLYDDTPPFSLSYFAKNLGIHYGLPSEQDFIPEELFLNLPELMMKYWDEIEENSPNCPAGFSIPNPGTDVFYLRREFVEEKIPTLRF